MTKEAVWKNFIDMIRGWVKDVPGTHKREFFESKDYVGYLTNLPAPLFNGVIQKNSAALRDLDKQTLFFLKSALPFAWWIDPAVHPVEDGKMLEGRELNSAGTYTGIAAPAKTFAIPKMPGITVREVTNLNDLAIWGKILGPNFGFDDPFMEKYCHMVKEFGPGKPYRHYLGYLNNKPVGCISLYGANGISGIWNLAVMPEARQKGVATMMTVACMNEAAKQGYPLVVAILMAGKMASALFGKFGFKDVCHLVPYIFGYDPKALEPTTN